MDIENLKENLKEVCIRRHLNFLVLFGSQARKSTHAKSDIDLAVSFVSEDEQENQKQKSLLIDEISTILKREDIEIVDVENISTSMMFAVARDALVLFEKEVGSFLRWKLFAVKYFYESEWLRKLAYKNLKEYLFS